MKTYNILVVGDNSTGKNTTVEAIAQIVRESSLVDEPSAPNTNTSTLPFSIVSITDNYSKSDVHFLKLSSSNPQVSKLIFQLSAGSVAIIALFDVTSSASFENVQKMLLHYFTQANATYKHLNVLPNKVFLLGNKCDKVEKVSVTQDSIVELEQSLHQQFNASVSYFDISALTGFQMQEFCKALFKFLFRLNKNNS